MTKEQKTWQRFIHVIAIAIVILDFFLLLTNRWPFSWVEQMLVRFEAFPDVAGIIIGLLLVLGILITPFVILRLVIEKVTGKSLVE